MKFAHPVVYEIFTQERRRIGIIYFFMAMLVIDFLLLHFNQRSGQTIATAILLFSPFLLVLKRVDRGLIVESRSKWVYVFLFLYVSYSFYVFTSHDASQLSQGKYRDLMFWLLLPVTLIVVELFNPTYKFVFRLFAVGALMTAIPVIKDLILGLDRGMASAQPMYWGNLALLTGFIAFILSRASEKNNDKILGYLALLVSFCASFWSQTRGGWVGIPVFIFLLVLFNAINIKQCLVIIVVVALFLLSMPYSRDRLFSTYQHVSSGEVLHQDDKAMNRSSAQQRLDMWRFALERLPANLWLGGGLAFFKESINKEVTETGLYQAIQQNNNVHNELLEVLISRGGVGVFLLFMLLSSLLSIFYFNPKNKMQAMVRLAGVVFIVEFGVFSLTSVVFSAKYPLCYFTTGISLLMPLIVE